jgi:hypothetical protein
LTTQYSARYRFLLPVELTNILLLPLNSGWEKYLSHSWMCHASTTGFK